MAGNTSPAGLGVIVDDGRQGARIRGIYRGSPAEQAGLQIDDEIIELDDQQVESPEELVTLIRRKHPNSRVKLRIVRNGRTGTLTTSLQSRRNALSIDGQDYNIPPGHNDLWNHVDGLERQVERLSNEIADLRQMMSTPARTGRSDNGDRPNDRR